MSDSYNNSAWDKWGNDTSNDWSSWGKNADDAGAGGKDDRWGSKSNGDNWGNNNWNSSSDDKWNTNSDAKWNSNSDDKWGNKSYDDKDKSPTDKSYDDRWGKESWFNPDYNAAKKEEEAELNRLLMDLQNEDDEEVGGNGGLSKGCLDSDVHVLANPGNHEIVVWDTWEKCAQGIPDALIHEMQTVAGFARPTPIQAYVWPCLMRKEDLIGVAKTGSGKTLAFLIPMFIQIKIDNMRTDNAFDKDWRASPWAIVISPTRELCQQINEETEKFGKPVDIRTRLIYGGNQDRRDQLELAKRRNPHLVVCTPGRMADYVSSNDIEVDRCKFFVLDEADRLLDMGFEYQLRQIMCDAPSDRQSLLFSATFPKSLKKLARQFTYRDAIHIQVGSADPLTGNSDIFQSVVECRNPRDKTNQLWNILNERTDGYGHFKDDSKFLVFCRSKRSCSDLAWDFENQKFPVCCIHGDVKQSMREWALQQFRNAEKRIMFATDVASRGLDIDNITHVINYDCAENIETHTHRIGRTARAGKKGEAITFMLPDENWVAGIVVQTMKKAGQQVPHELLAKAKCGRYY